LRNILLYYVGRGHVTMIVIIITNSLTRSLYNIWVHLSPFPLQLWLICYFGIYIYLALLPWS